MSWPKLAADRPDLVKLGEFAGQYGFVMNGGTSAKALPGLRAAGQGVHRLLGRPESLDDGARRTPRRA